MLRKFRFVVCMFVFLKVFTEPNVIWSTVCPMYFFLHAGQVHWYTPLFSYLFCLWVCCTDRSLPLLLLVMNVVLTSLFLKSLVINLVSFAVYVNFVHFKLRSSCFCFCFPFVPVTLFRTEVYLLLCNICFNVFVFSLFFRGSRL